MKLKSLTAEGLVSFFVLAATVSACSEPPTALDEATDSTEATETLPGETDLATLEDSAFETSAASASLESKLSVPVPDACTDDKLQKTFRCSEKLGSFWVHWMWRHFRCCHKVEKFVDALMVLLEKLEKRAATQTGARHCRLAGIVAGALEAVENTMKKCENDCYDRGEEVGSRKAKTYCDLAIAAKGNLNPPTWTREEGGLCRFAYQVGCEAGFFPAAAEYINNQGKCAPYTSAPFDQIYETSLEKACDYSQRNRN